MKGCAHAATRDYAMMIEQAWRVANFRGAGAKLKELKHYLPKHEDDQPEPAVQPEVILDAMLMMQAHGVPMQVRKVTG
jgi:hypothetical protein